MSMIKLKQPPLYMDAENKRDVRTQFAALCYRICKDDVQILLITSRTARRWIIPKGWPMEGLTPAHAAATEAYEEAGVKGEVSSMCIGFYAYKKIIAGQDELPCAVSVFPLRVTKLYKDWPEASERKRRWFSPKKASTLVREPELCKLIKQFDARSLTP